MLTLGAMVTCGFLAVWQWHRAGSAMGSALNVGYGLQWPLFALFFGFFWWRFLQMELRSIPGRDDAGPAAEDAPEIERAAPAGDDVEIPQQARAQQPAPQDERPSPFGPRPAGVEMSRLSDPQLRAYNDELSKLATRNQET